MSGGGAGTFDAIVLAGGLARRFEGASKPDVVVDGRRMLDHVLAAVAGARRIVLVAPQSVTLRDGAGAPVDPGRVLRTMEDPPRGGPAAGLAAGLEALGTHGAPRDDAAHAPEADDPDDADAPDDAVVVLSCDVPRVGPAVPRLLDALAAAGRHEDGVCLVTVDARRGPRRQPLVAAYRRGALEDALARVRAARGTLTGASIRETVAHLTLAEHPARGTEGVDVDSWDDLAGLTGS